MSTVCAASCGKTKFTYTYDPLCNNPLGSKILKVGITLCDVDLACPTVKEDIEAQITAGTFMLLSGVRVDWAAPTHNYVESAYSYNRPKYRKDTTYSGTIFAPYNPDNEDFMEEEVNGGKYQDLIFATEDGPMFTPRTSIIVLAASVGPDADGNLAHIIEFEFTQKKGTLKGYAGRAPIYEAEDA